MHLLVVRNPPLSLSPTVRTICHNYYSFLPRRTYSRKTPSVPNHTNSRCAMATASRIQLSLDTPGVFHVSGIIEESAAKASEVLQENHENHHIFFNQSGFHSTFRCFRRFGCSGALSSSGYYKSPNALRSRTKSDLFGPVDVNGDAFELYFPLLDLPLFYRALEYF